MPNTNCSYCTEQFLPWASRSVLSEELLGYMFRLLSSHLQTEAGQLVVKTYSRLIRLIKRNKQLYWW